MRVDGTDGSNNVGTNKGMEFKAGDTWLSPGGHRFKVVTVNGRIAGLSAVNGPSYFTKPVNATDGWKRLFPL